MASIADYRLIHASASTHPPSSLDSFTLHAPPVTDLWRKPAAPYVESDNAPSLITSTKLHAFRAAEVTVSATWTRLYDQAGLVLIAPASEDQKSSWVKTGIEFYNGKPNLSTVATPRASTSDWSLVPLSEHTVRIRVEREVHAEALSPSLWVYLMKENGERLAVREITWFFEGATTDHPRELLVGAYTARPTKDPNRPGDTEELEVTFTKLHVEISGDNF
ncbi:hypothetical protein FRB94_012083 [Tulasnella sp. JGI-2019a]|nr:hypothetical protein FRB94_012083 [Tulasnella sp. JGI-2019a]